MSPMRRALSLGMILFLLSALGACSEKNKRSIFDADAGHPKNWVERHGQHYLKDMASCTGCHGADRMGGVSKVSCFSRDFKGFTCHPGGPETLIHPRDFGPPGAHGPLAKAEPGPESGFALCKKCHGAGFDGGLVEISCFSCHGVNAPHARRPWRGRDFTHINTHQGNAAVCADCHRRRGGTPGCFNDTLCHGLVGVHPGNWDQPGQHGAAAKRAPDGMQGFDRCRDCHGDEFGGGSSDIACFDCHGLDAPHPRPPWRGGAFTHVNTNEANAPVCALCHRSTPGPAGCFNGTLCHTAESPHPGNFDDPDVHGAVAKGAPGVNRGFDFCRDCHGSLFGGGSANLNCFGCHGVNAPHSPRPWRDGRTHTNTNAGNAEVCGLCHRDPNAPAGTPSGCFNDTLCH